MQHITRVMHWLQWLPRKWPTLCHMWRSSLFTYFISMLHQLSGIINWNETKFTAFILLTGHYSVLVHIIINKIPTHSSTRMPVTKMLYKFSWWCIVFSGAGGDQLVDADIPDSFTASCPQQEQVCQHTQKLILATVSVNTLRLLILVQETLRQSTLTN